MRLSTLISAMQSIAPLHLAEEWDNVGLLIGDADRELQPPVLLTIDLTPDVAEEAIAAKAGAIVAYHPPLFRPWKKLTGDTPHGSMLLRLIERGIAVYSPHTALDAADGGVTDWLIDQVATSDARTGGGTSRSALTAAAEADRSQTHKIVTFVPKASAERVRDALAAAGAGVIGAYEVCSFTSDGRGSFRAGAGAKPTIGTVGSLERVDEVRLEMVCGSSVLADAVAALRAAHPYEEPAFDIYTLAPKPSRGTGSGRIVTLDQPASVDDLAQRLKSRLGVSHVLVARPKASSHATSITTVAAVPGSGAALLEAAISAGATCFVTGEMKHHEVLAALEQGCAVILAGHTETERGYLPHLASKLNAINAAFCATVSTQDRPLLALQ